MKNRQLIGQKVAEAASVSWILLSKVIIGIKILLLSPFFLPVLTMPPVIVHVSSCWAVSVDISTLGEPGRKKLSTCLWTIRFSRWTPLASASESCKAQHVFSACRSGFTATYRAVWPLVDHISLFQLESNHRPPDDSWQNHIQRPDEWVFLFY